MNTALSFIGRILLGFLIVVNTIHYNIPLRLAYLFRSAVIGTLTANQKTIILVRISLIPEEPTE